VVNDLWPAAAKGEFTGGEILQAYVTEKVRETRCGN
jgi:hypothetical protein